MLSSVLTLRPLRRCLFSIIGGYAMTALLFQTVDDGNHKAPPRRLTSKHQIDQSIVLVREMIREYAALCSFFLSCIVVSRGTPAMAGAIAAVATYRAHEVADLQAKCKQLKETLLG